MKSFIEQIREAEREILSGTMIVQRDAMIMEPPRIKKSSNDSPLEEVWNAGG